MEEIDEWAELEEPQETEEIGGTETEAEIRAGLCQKVAERVLRECGITEPPVPVEEIARKHGFAIEIRDLAPGVDARLRVTSSAKVIQLARDQALTRRRFSVAHELGHHFLGHRHGSERSAEVEANILARETLVPRPWLTRDIKQGLSVAELTQRYQVSREVIFIAAKGARLLNRLR